MSKKHWKAEEIAQLTALRLDGLTWDEIAPALGVSANCARKAFYRYLRDDATPHKEKAPKILVIDIETSPITSYTWGLFDQNIGLNMILEDWSILSWCAKWLGSDKVFYNDTRNEKNHRNDKNLLQEVWNLLDQADIVVGQNSTSFDIKKLNARFILNGMKPPSSFRQMDTMRIAKKHFKFTSNKLEYLTKNLCTDHKKLSHHEFAGFELWKECLAGNQKAFLEMEKYNIEDVLSTEELLFKLLPWDKTINLNTYSSSEKTVCTCGGEEFLKKGFLYTNFGKYQRFICTDCGKEHTSRENLHNKNKRTSLKK